MSQVFCPACSQWLDRPDVAAELIIFCRKCGKCLETPSSWQRAVAPDAANAVVALRDQAAAMDSSQAPAAPCNAGWLEPPALSPCEKKLGDLQEIHATPWSSSMMPLLGGFTCLVILMALATWSFFAPDDYSKSKFGRRFGCPALMFLPLLVMTFLFWGLRNLVRPQTILVFTGGLVRLRFRRIHVFLWDQITLFDNMRGGFSLRNAQGNTMSFDVLGGTAAHLIERVRQEVWQRAMPRATSLYETGGCAVFGKFGVSKAGLTFKRRFLTWDDIFRITIDPQGKFTVSKKGGVILWAAMPVGRIPNFQVFEALVEREQPVYRLTLGP